MAYFANKLCTQIHTPEVMEGCFHSVITWLSVSPQPELIDAFKDRLLAHKRGLELIKVMTTLKIFNNYDEISPEFLPTAVALTCDIAVSIQNRKTIFLVEPNQLDDILIEIATYLSTLSNINNDQVRMSLMSYFGFYAQSTGNREYFNRIIDRFGFTVLEKVSHQLSNKKTQATACSFLTQNLIFFLEGGGRCQDIVHQLFRLFMLREFEHFSIFIHYLANYFVSSDTSMKVQKVFIQHIAILLKVAAEFQNKVLIKELIKALEVFQGDPYKNDLYDQMIVDPTLPDNIKKLLYSIQSSDSEIETANILNNYSVNKKGRKAKMIADEETRFFNQVYTLAKKIA